MIETFRAWLFCFILSAVPYSAIPLTFKRSASVHVKPVAESIEEDEGIVTPSGEAWDDGDTYTEEELEILKHLTLYPAMDRYYERKESVLIE